MTAFQLCTYYVSKPIGDDYCYLSLAKITYLELLTRLSLQQRALLETDAPILKNRDKKFIREERFPLLMKKETNNQITVRIENPRSA